MKVLFIRRSGPNPTNKVGEILTKTIVTLIFDGMGHYSVHQLSAHHFEETAVCEATPQQIQIAVEEGWAAYPHERVKIFRGKTMFGFRPVRAFGKNYCT